MGGRAWVASATLGALGVTTCLEHAWAGGLADVGGLFLFLFLTAGMVLSSAQAVEQLNIKAKNFRDLLTDEPFSRQDIITLQVSVPSHCCFWGDHPENLGMAPLWQPHLSTQAQWPPLCHLPGCSSPAAAGNASLPALPMLGHMGFRMCHFLCVSLTPAPSLPVPTLSGPLISAPGTISTYK